MGCNIIIFASSNSLPRIVPVTANFNYLVQRGKLVEKNVGLSGFGLKYADEGQVQVGAVCSDLLYSTEQTSQLQEMN